jgi:CubicO group peptidase (beta-lactamase class C family)
MRQSIFLFILLCTAVSLPAQRTKSVSSILQLTDSIEVLRKEAGITGLLLGIVTKDSVLYSGGFGFANLETRRTVSDSTLFRMGSITKMFVSLGILQLVNEGKLHLEDELRTIAPEVPQQNKWAIRNPVRIIHLLEHTSGFDDIKLNRMYSQDTAENKGIRMMLAQQNSMICRWKPGERFAYSNPNYAILAYVIEKITGKPYDQYLKESILLPLGMNNSNFNVRSKYPLKDTREYIFKNSKTIPVKSVTLVSGPYGALWSSASDMVRFLRFFLRSGKPLFDEKTISEMETVHSSLAAKSGLQTGYALANEPAFLREKYPFQGHDGIAGTCFSSFRYNRKLGVGFVIATNSNTDTDQIQKLIMEYLTYQFPANDLPHTPIDVKAIEPFLGRYQFESPRNEIGALAERFQNAPFIFLKNEALFFKPLFGEAEELIQTAPMIFTFTGMNSPALCFTKNEEGQHVMLIYGSYFVQTSGFWSIFKRVNLVLVLLLALSGGVCGIVSLIASLMGKLCWQKSIIRILPLLAIACILPAILKLLEVKRYTYKLSELGTINSTTLLIFLGSLLFGILACANLVISLRAFFRSPKTWFDRYILLYSISLCLIATLLWQNGWIGLRTWAL